MLSSSFVPESSSLQTVSLPPIVWRAYASNLLKEENVHGKDVGSRV